MPYVNNQRGGTLILDRTFKGVGRIQKSTGVTTVKDFELLSSMLTELYRSGKHGILREIRDGKISILETYGYYHSGQLAQTPSALTLRPISPTIEQWIEQHDLAESTRKAYKAQFSVFVKLIGKNTQITDLPMKLKVYRDHCQKKGTLRSFNYVRSILQSFLNRTLGRSHPLWEQVSQIQNFTIKSKDMKQAPQLSVVEAQHLIWALPVEHARIVEAMIFTGMGWSEVNGEWWEENDRIVVRGTKRESRDRVVPLVQPQLSRPTRKKKSFSIALKKVRSDLTTHSFRRSYAHWLEEAQVIPSRIAQYLGHSVATQTEKYTKSEVTKFLTEDGEKIRTYILKMWEERNDKKDETTVEPISVLKPINKIPW